MSNNKSLNRAHAALQGIDSRNGFLGEETLVRLVQAESFLFRLRRYSNERMRAFRDSYREYSRQLEKLSRKNLVESRGLELTHEWIATTIRYLGYDAFIEDALSHWSDEGSVLYRRSESGSHSVGAFFYAGSQQISSIDEAKLNLTDTKGNETFRSPRKESLAEQVERAMRAAALPEAILITPHFVCYFRADSKITGSCLEVQWTDVFKNDNDTSAVLATSLLHRDFFAYSSPAQTEDTTSEIEETDTDNDSEEGDEEESRGGSQTTAKATPSQELFKEDLEQARKITEDLHRQVMLALEILANERIEVDPDLKKKALSAKSNELVTQGLFKDGLFVLYRILFVLYAEARRFLPVENSRYASFYSVEHLRDWSEEHLKRLRYGDTDGSGTYIWDSLKTIFTLLRRGVNLPGGELVSAYNGQLFSPDQAPLFDEGPALRDAAMAKVLTTISRIGGNDSSRRLHFGNLGIEQLGAVYEALLAQRPVIVREPSCWVVAHPVGVGLVTRDFAAKMGHIIVEPEAASGLKSNHGKCDKSKKKLKSPKNLGDFIVPERPAYNLRPGRFVIAPLGGQRRQTASHYTPPKLAEFLVKRTLKPLVEGKSSEEILNLKIVEPAVGSGGFLIACLRYMAPHLLEAKKRERKIELNGREASFHDLQECKREILERCLFGVDINPLSLELCRTSLYLEALVPGFPLPFLHHRLKSGNALVYADLLGKAKSTFHGGVVANNEEPSGDPTFWSIFELPIEPLKVEKNVWAARDQAQEAYGKRANSQELAEILSNRIKELKSEKKSIDEHNWVKWAIQCQPKVTKFLKLSQQAILEFELLQKTNTIVDGLADRHKDRLCFIPDMDPVIIDAQGLKIDSRLEHQRKQALIREHGIKAYDRMVMHQRAYMRLKALCDLHCALWFWPVDLYATYPSHQEFKSLVDWILDESSLDRTRRHAVLDSGALRLLKQAYSISRNECFFQWHVEFAQVFGGQNPGFDVVISNPPWKVVGTKDKEVYPTYDPYFLKTKASKKASRILAIQTEQPWSADRWLRENFITKRITTRWASGIQADIPSKGQVDLSNLFVLNSERLIKESVAPTLGGRIGLLVSRSAVFLNNGTRNVRERLFREWSLTEAISFSNSMDIFSIHRQYEFTCLVGQPGFRTTPQFVHGVADPNQLDTVDLALSSPIIGNSGTQHHPIRLTAEMIQKCFSREILAIPGLTDVRQADIASNLHHNGHSIVYLDQLTVETHKGIDPTNKANQCVFLENLSQTEVSSVLSGCSQKYVGLLKGRHLSPSGTFLPSESDLIHAAPISSLEQKLNSSGQRLLWRAMANPSNQRTLIASLVTGRFWFDGNVYGILGNTKELKQLELILNSVAMDFLIKLVVRGALGLAQLTSLPIANYDSSFLHTASKIRNHAERDALVWLHYGQNKGALNRKNLEWMLDTQFDCLKRNNPDYIRKVLEAFDHYSKQKEMYGVDPTPIFKLKEPKVIEIQPGKSQSAKKQAPKTQGHQKCESN